MQKQAVLVDNLAPRGPSPRLAEVSALIAGHTLSIYEVCLFTRFHVRVFQAHRPPNAAQDMLLVAPIFPHLLAVP